ARSIIRADRWRQVIFGTLLLGVIVAICVHPSLASIPWTFSTLNWTGINGDAPMAGRPMVLIRPVRAFVAGIIYIAGCLILADFANARDLIPRAWTVIVDDEGKHFALAAMTRFCIVYFAFLMVRGADFDIFDRHLLPILPWVATVFLLWPSPGDQRGRTF